MVVYLQLNFNLENLFFLLKRLMSGNFRDYNGISVVPDCDSINFRDYFGVLGLASLGVGLVFQLLLCTDNLCLLMYFSGWS